MQKIYISIALIFLFFAVSREGYAGEADGEKNIRTTNEEIDPALFLAKDRFVYYEEDLTISFRIEKSQGLNSFTGVLFSILSNDNIDRRVMIDWDRFGSAIVLFVLFDEKIEKYILPLSDEFMDFYSVPVRLQIDFRKNMARMQLGNVHLELHNFDFSTDYGYKFHLLPELSKSPATGISPILEIKELEVKTEKMPEKRSFWHWLAILLAVDIVIFLFVWLSARRKRKGTDKSNIVKDAGGFTPRSFPKKSAAYVFGEMRVYDAEGEDISKRFSPLMRELFILLIVSSTEEGISSERMKELLWFDKSTVSARNNRAVYFGKLRALLDTVGRFDLNNDSGYWKLHCENIFIDYFEYDRIARKQEMSREDVEMLMSLTLRGNLLPDTDYRWLDNYKSAVSNATTETLWNFAVSLKADTHADLLVVIADIIFLLEHINERGLYLKCKAYSVSGRHSQAKKAYDIFCEEYREVYGEDFLVSFTELLEKDYFQQ